MWRYLTRDVGVLQKLGIVSLVGIVGLYAFSMCRVVGCAENLLAKEYSVLQVELVHV